MPEDKKPRDWTEARFHVTDAIKNDFSEELMAEAVYKPLLTFAFANNMELASPNELVRVYTVENKMFKSVKVVAMMIEEPVEREGSRDHVYVMLWDEMKIEQRVWAEGRIKAIDEKYKAPPDGEDDGDEDINDADWWKKGSSGE